MNTKRIITLFTVFLTVGLVVVFSSRSHRKAPSQPALGAASHSLDERAAAYERKAARADYFFRLMRDPATDAIPRAIRQRELAYARTLPGYNARAFKTADAPALTWTEAGPNNVGGRTRGLGIDVANTQVIVAGGVTGGIWKSTDRGASWRLKTAQHLPISTLAQDPRAGQTTIWYAATGEFSGTVRTVGDTPLFGSGFYKSTDNGETWQLLHEAGNTTAFDTQYDNVVKVVVSPTTGTVIMATNLFGIFRSTDGGATFTGVLGNTVNDHAWSDVAVASNGTLAAVLSSDNNNDPKANQGVYRSNDDGATWTNITPNTFPSEHQRSVLAIAPSNPDAAYVLTYDGFDDTAEAMYFHKITLSTGASDDRSANLPVFDDVDEVNGIINTQSSYNMAIAVKPDDEDLVLVGGTSLFRSRDGFATAPDDLTDTWIGGYMTDGSNGDYPNHHPDIQGLYFDPGDADFLWSVHDGGVSTLADAATNQETVPWVDKNTSYNVTQFYHVAQAAAAGDTRIFGGTQDNGSPFFRSDGTATGASTDRTGGDGAYSYLGTSFALGSTTNGAVDFKPYDNDGVPADFQGSSPVTPPGAENQLFINPFAVDPVTENVLYYPDGDVLWRGDLTPTINGGNDPDWTEMTNVGIPNGFGLTALAASTTPAHVLYLGASSATDPPKIFRLDNADTATDGEVERSIPGAPNGAYLHAIAVNPANADEILVALSNYNIVGLYHSSDGGQTYTAVEGNLEGNAQNPGPSIRATSILPFGGETTYLAGTSTGVYSTTTLNGANTTWTQEGANVVGNNVVESITARTSDGRIALATHGRGIFLGMPEAPPNQAPAFTATLPDTTITVGNTLTFTYTASDPDNDALTFSLTRGPQDATLDASTGAFSWTPSATGMDSVTVTVSDGSLTASTSALVTVVGATATEEEELPLTFALNQNYPNPFNPSTTIAFSLAQPSLVTLTIYDLAGRKVASLLAGDQKTPGRHAVSFDARGLASGTYVYRLEAKPTSGQGTAFVESKSMVLLK